MHFFILDANVEKIVRDVKRSLENANLLLLTNHATDKDRSLKISDFKVSTSGIDCEIAGECIWTHNGCYKDESSEMNLTKTNYPELNLIYINQAYLTVKKSKNIVYGDYKLLGQMVPAANPPSDISTHKLGDDEFNIIKFIYDMKIGESSCLKETILFASRKHFSTMVMMKRTLKFFIHTKEEGHPIFSTGLFQLSTGRCL